MVNAESLAGGWYKLFLDYLILSPCAFSEIKDAVSVEKAVLTTLLYFTSTLKKTHTPEKDFLPGYPILFIKRNGIMVNVEILAGGWYKLIFDYLIISHCAFSEIKDAVRVE